MVVAYIEFPDKGRLSWVVFQGAKRAARPRGIKAARYTQLIAEIAHATISPQGMAAVCARIVGTKYFDTAVFARIITCVYDTPQRKQAFWESFQRHLIDGSYLQTPKVKKGA